jgi:hypothetical protein
MSKVPAHGYSFTLCKGGYGWNIEELAGVVVNTGEQEDGCGIGMHSYSIEDVLGREIVSFWIGGLDEDESVFGREVVVCELGIDCVLLCYQYLVI